MQEDIFRRQCLLAPEAVIGVYACPVCDNIKLSVDKTTAKGLVYCSRCDSKHTPENVQRHGFTVAEMSTRMENKASDVADKFACPACDAFPLKVVTVGSNEKLQCSQCSKYKGRQYEPNEVVKFAATIEQVLSSRLQNHNISNEDDRSIDSHDTDHYIFVDLRYCRN